MKLGGEEFVRTIGLGSAWGRIRIGVLCTVTANSTSDLSGLMFYLGLCHGNRSGVSHPSTDSFTGVSWIGLPGVGANLTYNAGSGAPYYTASTAGKVFRRVRGIDTNAAAAGTASIFIPDETGVPSGRRAIYIIDINKHRGTPVFPSAAFCTITCYHINASQNANCAYRPDELQDAVDYFGTPAVRGTNMIAWTAATDIGGTDTHGPLNSLCLWWSSAQFPLNIYAICASGMYDTFYPDVGGAYNSFYSANESGSVATQISSGGYWSSVGTFSGTAGNGFLTLDSLAGTVLGPYDPWEQYGNGTILSGVQPTGPLVINAGTGWNGAGVVNP